MKPSEDREHCFLVVGQDEPGFILNRDQVFSSAVILEDSALEHPFGYFASVINYHGDSVAVFDLDAFFRDHFKYESAGDLKISLISDLSSFSDSKRLKYENSMTDKNIGISRRFIGLKIKSHAMQRRFALSEIRLLPPGVRKRQKDMGVLGCRFSKRGHVQYFLDIETVVFNDPGIFETDLRG